MTGITTTNVFQKSIVNNIKLNTIYNGADQNDINIR